MANKGFSLDLDGERGERKLLEFRAGDLAFREGSPVSKKPSKNVRDDLWTIPPVTEPESKTSRFFGLSAMAHALFLIGLMTLSAPLFEPPKIETVEIEISDPTPKPIPRGTKMAETRGAPAPRAPEAARLKEEPAAAAPGDIVVPRRSPPKSKTAAKPVAAKTRTVKAAPVPARRNAVSAVQPVATVSDVEVPESVDDLEAPRLDENEFKAEAVGPLNAGDLDKNFAPIDRKTSKGVKAVADELDRDADQMAKSDLEALEDMDLETQKEAALMAARSNDLKKKNAAALAAAQAQENAAREKAAHDAAARAEAARQAQGLAAGNGRGNGRGSSQSQTANGDSGAGSGSRGSTQGPSGVPNGQAIRNLEQLRQMPGNPKPTYNDNERIAKQQGNVVFLAYITREGYPTQFRQERSTGYANLDGKTLDALKKWRFYPGQEGWVEIPFSWDLKGGANETRALGARQAGGRRSSLRTSN